jgi:hypothetical protein
MTTLYLKTSLAQSPLRLALLLIALVFACFALSPTAQAVSPAPDGGYPGQNTAEGQNALLSLTSGGFNTANGWLSLRAVTTGSFNTGVGAGTLALNTADNNTATGAGALLSNSGGSDNTANGAFALLSNTSGQGNTATGFQALFSNATSFNTANGYRALFNNTASLNTAIGSNALSNNTFGLGNIGLGNDAGANVTTASNVTCIGALGANVDNSCYIGRIFGAGVSGGSVAVFVGSDGKLATNISSRRFGQDIEPMEKASEAILALNPVTFHYRSDKTNTAQFGLIAEEVAEVNPDLVVRDKDGELLSVRYDAVNAMVLNEFLKEHHIVQEQGATIARLEKQIEALTAGLQKVSTQLAAASPSLGGLDASKFATGRIRRGGPTPQVVNNP